MKESKELSQKKADAFFSLKAIGLIGVSSNSQKFGNLLYKELKKKNINVYQLHNNLSFANEFPCYSSIDKIPEKIEGIIINVKRKKVKPILEEYFNQGINNFWIQSGSESEEVREFCNKNNIEFVDGKCALMFVKPVNTVHRFHKAIWKWFGKN